MANVEPYVQQIRSAVYGEQVRESIARSIEEMNQDNIDTQAHYDNTIASANTAINNANTAATGANNIKIEVEQKLADGDFDGPQGPQGEAASIRVGTVQTGDPGTAAQVNNSGTEEDAVLNFIIPRGATGNVENLDTVPIVFPIDDTFQNIASGMTIQQLFSRIQLLLDEIMMTRTEINALKEKLGISGSSGGLATVLDAIVSAFGKVLWTGNLAVGGTVTVPGSAKYTLFLVYAGGNYMGLAEGGYVHVSSVAASTDVSSGQQFIRAGRFSVSGDSWTLNFLKQTNHNVASSISPHTLSGTALNVTRIIGLVPKWGA